MTVKVLILTVTAGQGHNSTARAVADELTSRGHEARVVDTFKYLAPLIGETIDRSYLATINQLRRLYRAAYRRGEERRVTPGRVSPVRLSAMAFAPKMAKYIAGYDPDVVLCTHVLASMVLDVTKQYIAQERAAADKPRPLAAARHLPPAFRAYTCAVVTDFAFHPYWEESVHLDAVVTPAEAMEEQGLRKGFKKEQLLPLGIPINPSFAVRNDRAEALRSFGLDPAYPAVLLMSGSMGYGNSKKVVKQIDSINIPFQIIVVNGNNKRQYKSLLTFNKTYSGKCTLYPYGFVNNVEVMMSAADCIITKPGGLTVSEAISKALPMILVNPIPGQEERNVDFLLNNGIASLVTKNFPLDEAVYHMFTNPVRMETVRRTISAIGHPDATERLVNFVSELCKEKK